MSYQFRHNDRAGVRGRVRANRAYYTRNRAGDDTASARSFTINWVKGAHLGRAVGGDLAAERRAARRVAGGLAGEKSGNPAGIGDAECTAAGDAL